MGNIAEKVKLQPLRVPGGWLISWNTLFELDPTEDNIAAGYFGGDTKFYAVNKTARLIVDVSWTPEDDPNGRYSLHVEYVPWERTEKGRRIKNNEIDFSKSKIVHEYKTRERGKLVEELEKALSTYSKWIEHS